MDLCMANERKERCEHAKLGGKHEMTWHRTDEMVEEWMVQTSRGCGMPDGPGKGQLHE